VAAKRAGTKSSAGARASLGDMIRSFLEGDLTAQDPRSSQSYMTMVKCA
jgi:hypothetical protein